MKISPISLRRPDWLQIWAGGWSILSCTHFIEEYVRLIDFHGQPFLPESIIIIRHGKSQSWARQKHRESLSIFLAREVSRNTRRAKAICRDLKKQSDSIRLFMAKHKGRDVNQKVYIAFWDKMASYYKTHGNVKYVIDGLSAQRVKQLLPDLEDARRYSENVYFLSERWLEQAAKCIGANNNLPGHLILCCTRQEMMEYFQSGEFPRRRVLEKRDKPFGIYMDRQREVTYFGHDAQNLYSMVTRIKHKHFLHGKTAYPGKVVGIVRVVHDPKKYVAFNRGDILVTGMTRPEFFPLIKKSSAFVTDAGGILSHAAIVAREMKKPCIIGTKVATKVFKDGDKIEVDANKGMARKL